MLDRETYSYRNDEAIPAFDDAYDVVVMDAACALCSGAARVIARLDRRDRFRICPVQSPLGRALLVHYGLAADDPESWLFLSEGRAYESMDGIARAAGRLGGVAAPLGLLGLVPVRWQDSLYRWVARNRYRLFGGGDLCAMPDPRVRSRLIA